MYIFLCFIVLFFKSLHLLYTIYKYNTIQNIIQVCAVHYSIYPHSFIAVRFYIAQAYKSYNEPIKLDNYYEL